MEASPRFDVIAGYRLIRKLGGGDRSEVFLGHALDSTDSSLSGSSGVAVKIFQPYVGSDSIDREIRARVAVGGDGLAALLDLATMPDGRVCIVLERLDGRSLPAVLAARDMIAPGEAVTVLAPIIVAVAGLHAAGFAHSTLSQAAVHMTASGRPVLTSLGGLREVNSAQDDLIRADYGRLTVLLRSVFDHLDSGGPVGRRAEAVAAWFEMAATSIPFTPCLDELERRLFAWSPAAPVGVELPAASGGTRAVPGRVGVAADDVSSYAGPPHAFGESRPDTVGGHRRGNGRGHKAETTDRADGVSSAGGRVATGFDAPPMRAVRRLLRSATWPRRRMLLVVGCMTAAFVVLALTLLPPAREASQAGPPRAISPASTIPPAPETASDPTGPAAAAPDSAKRTGDASAIDTEAIGGDEPVAATAALLRARAVCMSGASVACLDDVDQAGSAALAIDRYELAQRAGEGENPPAPENAAESRTAGIRDPAGYTLGLTERTGDSALIALAPSQVPDGEEVQSEPASVLVIKGEAGWRIREFFDY